MAGQLHPKSAPRILKSQAETLLWKALRTGLPDGWRAWHSLRLRDGKRWEGEGDFVVAIPERGLLVLEVKGGQVECRDGLWYQNGKHVPAPREQVQRFVRHLVKRIEAAGVKAPPFGIACFFPEVEFSEGPDAGDLAGLVAGARELQWLQFALPKLAEKALPPNDGPIDTAWVEVVHKLWGETWSAHVRLRDRAQDAEDRAIALNEQQLDLLDVFGHHAHALIEGSAGTGKTVLARELSLRWSQAGKRVLYLCFTDALARTVGGWLADHAVAGTVVPEASSVRRRAEQLVGEPWREGGAWTDLLRQATERVRSAAAPYDLVVVDEAQDLEAADWALVEALAGPGGMWVFGDPRQQFWTERALPAHLRTRLGQSMNLIRQERNPPDVARLAAAYVGETLVPRAEKMAAAVEVVTVADDGLEAAVDAAVTKLVNEGALPSDIAIVSLAGQTRTGLGRTDHVGRHRVVRADDDAAAAHVVSDTFLRFKGLERPFIVVVELALAQADRYERRMHIALTRATVGVVVVAEPHVVESDPRLR